MATKRKEGRRNNSVPDFLIQTPEARLQLRYKASAVVVGGVDACKAAGTGVGAAVADGLSGVGAAVDAGAGAGAASPPHA